MKIWLPSIIAAISFYLMDKVGVVLVGILCFIGTVAAFLALTNILNLLINRK
jgi:hypothetical protein